MAAVLRSTNLKLPTGMAVVDREQFPTEVAGIEGQPPTDVSQTADSPVVDPRLTCRPTFQDPAEPATTTPPDDPTAHLALVVVESLPPELKQYIGSVDLVPSLTELHSAGWTPADLRLALPAGTWAGARGVGAVIKRIRYIAGKPPIRTAPTGRRPASLPECSTCGAASDAPRSERQIYAADGNTSLGPCPTCRPNDARRTA